MQADLTLKDVSTYFIVIMCALLVWKPAEVQYATYTSAMWTHLGCTHTENGLLSHPTDILFKCEIPIVHIYMGGDRNY